ncbi:MAG: ABC transporter ATP-binding protein [Chloroflexi bacterium]|nr:ABC transporter ATP-binding protein [Chloroflexota bacterium]
MTNGNPSGPMVEVVEAVRVFDAGETSVAAVDHVSLSVPRGEFLAIVGRSGSGKTTFLNLIAGLDQPTSGQVFVDGQEVSRFSDSELTQFRRHQVGFVFQSFGLLPLLSAAENIELALRIAGAGLRDRGERTRELLALVGLTERSHHRPYELSGGEQQRVAVARALANKPRLVIADEPTGELDSTTGAQIFALLREVARAGVTIIAATHDPFVIEHVDRVLEMSDGRILPEGEGLIVSQQQSRRSEQARSDVPQARPSPR